MTTLTKHTNKLNRKIKTLEKQNNRKKTEKINKIKENKKIYIGRIPLKDKKHINKIIKIQTLENKIKNHKKEIQTIKKRTKNHRPKQRTYTKHIHIKNI